MTVATCMYSTRSVMQTAVVHSSSAVHAVTLTSALTCSIEMSSELNGMSILVPAAGTVSTYLIGTTAAAESCTCRQTATRNSNHTQRNSKLQSKLYNVISIVM
jgi:hypothetical protein